MELFYDDDCGAVTKVRYDSGGGNYDASYEYDNVLRVTKVSDWMGGGGLRYAYDGANRLTRVTDYDNTYLTYAYDAANRMTSMTDYHSNTTTYAYDTAGALTSMTAPGSKTWTFAYGDSGQPTKVTIPNGMETHYLFDDEDRMTKIEHKDGATVVDSFAYALDDGGGITRLTQGDGSLWDYEYDARYRLTQAERYDTDGTTLLHRYSYTYDDGDNMLTKAVYDAVATTTATTAFAYNDANELTSSAIGGTTTSYAYDAYGRMTSKADGTYTATYDYRYGMLYAVTSNYPSEGNVSYDYGSDGKRRSRTAGGTTTKYKWDGWMVVNEEDSSGNLTMTYVGHTVADVTGSDPSTGTYRYYFHDHLDSTRRLHAQDKSSLATYEFSPYGEQYATAGSATTTHQYATLAWDGTAGLHFAAFRYLEPRLARWMSQDPVGYVEGLNLYAYVSNSPQSGVDPLGLWDICDPEAWDPTTPGTGTHTLWALGKYLNSVLSDMLDVRGPGLSGPGAEVAKRGWLRKLGNKGKRLGKRLGWIGWIISGASLYAAHQKYKHLLPGPTPPGLYEYEENYLDPICGNDENLW